MIRSVFIHLFKDVRSNSSRNGWLHRRVGKGQSLNSECQSPTGNRQEKGSDVAWRGKFKFTCSFRHVFYRQDLKKSQQNVNVFIWVGKYTRACSIFSII